MEMKALCLMADDKSDLQNLDGKLKELCNLTTLKREGSDVMMIWLID